MVTRAKDLPKGAVDIIITALEDQARYCTLHISVGDPDAGVFGLSDLDPDLLVRGMDPDPDPFLFS